MAEGSARRDGGTGGEPTLLKALLRERHWQTYRRFRREYTKAAAKLDKELAETCPSDSTYRRWLSGRIGGIPRAEPCAVLEEMFPGYTAEQLFEPYQGDAPDASSAQGDLIPVQLVSADGPPVAAWHDQSITVPTTPGPAERYPGAPSGTDEEAEDVNRKEFLAGLVAAIAAPGLVLSSSEPSRIGAAEVARYRRNLTRLYALDDHYGGTGEVYGLTVRSLRNLMRVLESSSYSTDVGNELRSIAGEVMEHAGWLAFDAGHHHDARYWWLEALHAARMTNDTRAEVLVLASMSCAASYHGRSREAADLATTAAQIARRDQPSPRLLSLLAAREALGHAYAGDRDASRRALDQAHTDLHQEGRHDADPPWLSFWGPSDLASHASRAAHRLGDLPAAERSAREALVTVDPARYPRNQALYQANLGAVLIARRNLDEGLPLVAGAALQSADINSARLATKVQSVIVDLQASHGDTPAVRDLAEWTTNHLSSPSPWPTTI
ncbi:MAG: hypothetical protein JO100_03135 [Pseudonocardia sp.]|nr:hypothetical protein [Pseudonocardia sp.]